MSGGLHPGRKGGGYLKRLMSRGLMSGGLCPGLLWGLRTSGGLCPSGLCPRDFVAVGALGSFGQGCICHDACDRRFMSRAIAQEAFGMGLMSRGFLQGAYV